MSVEIDNLEDIIKRLINAVAAQCDTTCEWVDLHAKKSAMANFQQHKLRIRVTNVHYAGNIYSYEMPGHIVEDTSINDTSSPQTSIFRHSKETTSSFTWTLKNTLKTGKDVKFFVSIPPIVYTSFETTEISTEATLSKTVTEVESWSIERHVTVAPGKKMEMVWTVKEEQSSGTFYADVVLTGNIAFWLEDDVDIINPGGDDEHNLWFIPIQSIFYHMDEMGISVPDKYTIAPGGVIYTIIGECNGLSGYDTTFVLNETSLNATTKSAQACRCIGRVSIPGY